MDGPELGSSRRSNGLRAPAYAPLADIDPQATEVVLRALARAGIGAYAEPAPGQVGGYLEVRLPDRPTDRLWADPSKRGVAREIVDRELATLAASLAAEPATDPDAAWKQIVAGFDRPTTSPVPPWPVSEDAGPGRTPPTRPRVVPEPVVVPVERADEDDEHYEPPAPPPVPRPHRYTALSGLAILAGLLLVLRPDLLVELDGSAAVGLGVLSIVVGAGALVWRMRDAPPADSGPDDGAVV
ncbi:MAG: hypothetical protein M3Z02_11930 [Actinomycetota bacterium]|nr:hypothetical protein [Actinomycetota bacterium]